MKYKLKKIKVKDFIKLIPSLAQRNVFEETGKAYLKPKRVQELMNSDNFLNILSGATGSSPVSLYKNMLISG
ncbi:MAG: hypothetical protein KDB74_06620, partial [Flavobacteriales bacterium]|nr:hypothetical protein [Flavobacteriales bacterium]